MIKKAIQNWRRSHGYGSVPFRAALIDMDGTLYDSMRNHAASWYRLMTGQGIECTPDEFYLYEGMTGAQTIRRLWERDGRPAPAEELIAELYHRKTVYFNELPLAPVMPGARAMTGCLAANDIVTVLVTGSGQPSVLSRLDNDYPGIFPDGRRVTARNVTHGKPSPEPYLKGMELAGVKPCESIVIENAPIGVQSGVASGAFTIAVTTGPVPAESLREAGADLVYQSMPALAADIDDILAVARSC